MRYVMLAALLVLLVIANFGQYREAQAQAPPAQPPPMACEEARGHLSALYETATAAEKSYREQAVIAARKLAERDQTLKVMTDELAKLKAAVLKPEPEKK